MKTGLLFLHLFLPLLCGAQVYYEGRIKDAATKEPIPFCAIGLKNTSTGWLGNEDGVFRINAVLDSDTLVFTLLGYKKKLMAVADFKRNATIYLESKTTALAEVVISANDNYLYDLMDQCRKSLFKPKQRESKVYYVLESEVANQPVELVECYYNGVFNNNIVKDLQFKNGRVGKTVFFDGRNFSSLNISKAFMLIDLLNKTERIPEIPFQLNKKKLKKTFRLKLISTFDETNPVYRIAFEPIHAEGKQFSGEAWIEKNSGTLKKITLNIAETNYHPFVTMLKELGEIKNVSMQITKTYKTSNGENILDHIDFDYQLNYHHIHNNSIATTYRDTSFEVKSKGLMYFYDHHDLFYIPNFNFNADQSDYRKISSLTYNEAFWNSNKGLVYSDKMKKALRYFKNNGSFLNYASGLNNKTVSRKDTNGLFGGFYENTYLTWTAKERLSLKKDALKNDTVHNKGMIPTLAYQLKANIFFDINPVGDSLQHFSICVFDVFDTLYNLPEEPFTNCFMNIYFDLFEIERRKMEKIMSQHKYSLTQLDSVYKQSVKQLDLQTTDYLKQVERGKNFKALTKWNAIVKRELNIDNIELFKLK